MISAPVDEKNLSAIERLIDKEIPRAESPLKGKKPELKDDKAEAPKRSRSRKAKADEPKVEESVSVSETPEEKSTEPKRERGGRGRGSDRGGKKVVGMGDHMPSFIAMSFAERKTG